jgi:hypothetical protein
MKVGDKVICIEDYNNGGWLPKDYCLTKGQLYEVSHLYVYILQKGNSHCERYIDKITIEGKGNVKYPTNLFITVEQHRENQLNQILS